MTVSIGRMILFAAGFACAAGSAHADKIKNPTAVFSGLDKITGRIVSFEVAIDETVQFGALQMTPRVCYTRPPTESPNTTSFLEVDEVTLDSKVRRVFTGWMFAASPGLHGIEHPVYDVWLVDCKGGTEVIAEPKEAPEGVPPQPTPASQQRRQAEPRPIDVLPGAAPAQPPGQAVPAPRQQRFFPTSPPPINTNR